MTDRQHTSRLNNSGPNSLIFRLKMAIDFYNAGVLASKQIIELMNDGDLLSAYPALSAPTANFAFSTELSLKLILKFIDPKQQNDKSNHDLLILFNKLTQETQKSIFKAYNDLDFRYFNIKDIKLVSTESHDLPIPILRPSISDFDELVGCLKDVSNHFVKGRYLYDNTNVNTKITQFPLLFFARFSGSLIYYVIMKTPGITFSYNYDNFIKVLGDIT